METCAICLDTIARGRPVWSCSRCANSLHAACFESWREHKPRCPYCLHEDAPDALDVLWIAAYVMLKVGAAMLFDGAM